MVNPKSILVTGCAGFIGSSFIKIFKKKFPKTGIVGIDDFSTGRRDIVDSSIIFYEGSITNEKFLENIFSKHKFQYIFHFAALPRVFYSVEHPRYTSEANIIGTVALLEASKNHGVKRFIYSSSSSVYGNAKKLPTKESENIPNPKSPYAVQKYASESFCKMFSELYGLDTVCLRYFNAFGPGQFGDSSYSTVVSAWLEALFFPKNKKAFIEGDGNQTRDFCYIDNIISANILSMESKKNLKGDVFNIANGVKTKINTVGKLIEKYTTRKLNLEKRPGRLGDPRHTHADIAKAKRVLGYTPKIDFDEGLKRTVVWFQSRTS